MSEKEINIEKESEKDPVTHIITETEYGALFDVDLADNDIYQAHIPRYHTLWREPFSKIISSYLILEDDIYDPDRTVTYYSGKYHRTSQTAIQLLTDEIPSDHFVSEKINIVIMDSHKLLSALIYLTEIAKHYQINEVHLIDEKYVVEDNDTSFIPLFKQFLEYFRANNQNFSLFIHSNWIKFAKLNKTRIDLSICINPKNPTFGESNKMGPLKISRSLDTDYVYLMVTLLVSRSNSVHLLSKQCSNHRYDKPDALINTLYQWESIAAHTLFSNIFDHIEKFDKTTANSVCDTYFYDKLNKHIKYYNKIKRIRYISLCDVLKMVSIDTIAVFWMCAIIYPKIFKHSPKWAKYTVIIILVISVIFTARKFWDISLLSKLAD